MTSNTVGSSSQTQIVEVIQRGPQGPAGLSDGNKGDVTVSSNGTAVSINAGVIVDADINADAEIAVSKLADGAARQLLQTNTAGTGVEWASNIDVQGTLDVTGAATFDSTTAFTGAATFSSHAIIAGNSSVSGTFTAIGSTLITDDVTIKSNNAFFKIQTGSGTDKFSVDTDNGNTLISGTLGVTGATTITGGFTANGTTTIGDADTDTLSITAKLNTDLIPSATTIDLGSSSSKFGELYLNGVANVGSISGDAVVTSGSSTSDTQVYSAKRSDELYFNKGTLEEIKSNTEGGWSANDNAVATTAAIDARIIDLVDDVGGFVPIANETSFPNANPDVNNGAGTIVSISLLSGNLTSNGSGVITIANGTVGNSTVTINGAGTSETYLAGYGMLVETTTTLNTYTFHRSVPKATEVTTVASKATEIGRLGTTAAIEDLGILGTTAIVSDMDTLADISSNITTVAGISSNVTTVAGISANTTTVAGVASNVTTVAGSIANVNTVATNINNVNDFSSIYRVASSAPGSNNDDGDLYYDTTTNKLNVYNGSAWSVATAFDAAGGTVTGQISFANNTVLRLGNTAASGQLQLFHDASNGVIREKTGSLYLQSVSHIEIGHRHADNSEEKAIFSNVNGAVDLYWNGAGPKLSTDANGILIQQGAYVMAGARINFKNSWNSNQSSIRNQGPTNADAGVAATLGNLEFLTGSDTIALTLDKDQNAFFEGQVKVGSGGHALNASTGLEIRGPLIGTNSTNGVSTDHFKALKLGLNDGTEWGSQALFSLGRYEEYSSHARSSLKISLGHGALNSSSDPDVDVLTLKSDKSATFAGFVNIIFSSAEVNEARGLFINNTDTALNRQATLAFSTDSGNRPKTAIAHIDTGSYGTGKLVFALDPDADDGEVNIASHEVLTLQPDKSATFAGQLTIPSKSSTYEGITLATPNGDGSGEFHIGVHESGTTSGRSIVFKRGGSGGFATESVRIAADGNTTIEEHIYVKGGGTDNKFATTANGIAVTGTTNGEQATFGGASSGLKISTWQKTNDDAGVTLDAVHSSNGTLTLNTKGAEAIRIHADQTVDIGFGANDKQLRFGAGSELKISAGSSSSTISSTVPLNLEVNEVTVKAASGGDSTLLLYSDAGEDWNDKTRIRKVDGGDLMIEAYNGTSWEDMARFITGDAVYLYTDGQKKFETTSDGSKVTGKLEVASTSHPETTGLLTEFKAGVGDSNRYKNRYIKIRNTYTGSAQGGVPIVWEANADGSNNKSYGAINIDSDGDLVFSNKAAAAAVAVGTDLGLTQQLRIEHTTGNATFAGKLIVDGASAYDAFSSSSMYVDGYVCMGRTDTTVSSGDGIGGLRFYSNDSSIVASGSFLQVGTVDCSADGDFIGDYSADPSTASAPTRMVFSTMKTGTTTLTEALRLDSSQNATFAGELKIASGKGINFSAVGTGGSSTSSLLDDYEEGIFAPTFYPSDAGGSYTVSNTGRYIKVGKLVSCWAQITWSAKGGNGNMRIGGLPFTVENVASNTATPVLGSKAGFSYPKFVGKLNSNGYIELEFVDATSHDSSGNYVATGTMDASGELNFSLQYEAD